MAARASQSRRETEASEEHTSAQTRCGGCPHRGDVATARVGYANNNATSVSSQLKKEGFKFVDDQPKKGADNKLVAFLHPKSSNGVLVELCQDIEKED